MAEDVHVIADFEIVRGDGALECGERGHCARAGRGGVW
jgi:hypothetical protein